MTYFYTYDRHGVRHESEHKTLDEALEAAWCNLEFESAWPVAIFEDLTLIVDNMGGHPLVDGSCKLNDMAEEWHRQQEADDA